MAYYVSTSLIMLLTFCSLLVYISMIDVASDWEIEISQWVQTLRTPTLDRVMVYLTLTADWPLNAIIAFGLIVTLLAGSHHWLAIHLGCICLIANIGVPLTKQLTERVRPGFEQTQLDTFSFPSGHTCIAALSAGVIALLVAQDRSVSFRIRAYGLAVLYAVVIATTRVYLSVHWVCDVLAGLVFAGVLLPAFAWQLHQSDRINHRQFSTALLTLVTLLAISYALLTNEAQLIRYGVGISVDT